MTQKSECREVTNYKYNFASFVFSRLSRSIITILSIYIGSA